MQYWLMKCEPNVYSISDLKRDKRTSWEGVRNYQARNFMRDDMKKGDWVFFYHSNAEPSGISGIAKIFRESHVDPTQFDKKSKYFDPKATQEKPIWMMVELEFAEEFTKLLPLELIRKEKRLATMHILQKGSRLSVTPVSLEEWNGVLALAQQSGSRLPSNKK